MDAIEFVIRYPDFLAEIRRVIKPELFPQLDELEKVDPHDLVRPEAWFQSENEARGFVWTLFLKRVEKVKGTETSIDFEIRRFIIFIYRKPQTQIIS